MPFYPDSDTLNDTMQALFDRLSRTPGATDQFAKSKLVIHVHISQPQAFILLNGRSRPVRFRFAPNSTPPDLSLYLDADILHQIWLSQIRLRDAFFAGQIKTKGSVFKAMQLAALFRQAEALYPQLLREKDLLPSAE
ncbi:MAG: SCP2 sterol-binding domain-containing protein [Chloroflexi bacterium]|nr:SCP2 sterol-binding domain-containing protein [Chloroflexota bacterium]